jgi:signal transduction histidine kinase
MFAFYRDAFGTGQLAHCQVPALLEGQPGYYHLVAQRQGEVLAVSLLLLNEPTQVAGATAAPQPAVRAHDLGTEAAPQDGELDRLVAQAPVAMALFTGPDYVITRANEPMATVWSRPLTQVLGRPVFDALPYVRNQGFEAIFADVLAHGTPYDLYEVPVTIDRAHTGRPTQGYFNLTYRPQRDAQGHITGILTSAYEVTDQVVSRQRVEQLNYELEARVHERTQQLAAALHTTEHQRAQLTAQQGLLSQILGQVPAAIATLHGPDHRYSFFNDQYQHLAAGRTARDQSVADVFPELVEQGIIHVLDAVYHSGQPFHGTEILLMLHDQATGHAVARYLDFTYQPLLDGQQQPQGVLVFALDVTDKVRARKQAETLQAAMLAVQQRQGQEHAAQQAELQRIYEQAPVAIGILRGPDYVIELANARLRALWGRSGAELLSQPLFDAVPEVAGQGFEAILHGVLTTGEPFHITEMPLQLNRAHTGRPTQGYFNFTFQPLYPAAPQRAGLIAVGTEVTEQVLARQQVLTLNQELSVANQQLTRTNADLDTFVYTASHDLKAPIANIEGLLLALRSDLPAEALHHALVPHLLDLMQKSVLRFQQTIGHLTELTQLHELEAGEDVDLASLLADVQLDLTALSEATAATLTVHLQGCEAVRVAPKVLRSVAYNLLSNALKYRAADRPAQVQFRGRCEQNRLVLDVQDNGLGLSAPQQDRLFGLFRRLHPHVEGSGVGLFMVKRLVENAGGTITVTSQLGVGSTFTVSLPI